jgi:hypothetical protein
MNEQISLVLSLRCMEYNKSFVYWDTIGADKSLAL